MTLTPPPSRPSGLSWSILGRTVLCRKKYNPIRCGDGKTKRAVRETDTHDVSIMHLFCSVRMFRGGGRGGGLQRIFTPPVSRNLKYLKRETEDNLWQTAEVPVPKTVSLLYLC